MELNDVLRRLEGVRKVSGGYVAKCPAHDDSSPSLSVSEGDGGRILLHCHAGCTVDAICGALGVRVVDIMPPREKPVRPRVKAVYDYEDEQGRKVYRVTRYEPKDFRQAAWRDGRLIPSMKGVKRVPYHLPAVLAAAKAGRVIFVAEGEKDAESLAAIGATATCNAGGAGRWQAEWAAFFKGVRRVFVIADNDTREKGLPGQKHAVAVRDSLRAAGIDAVAFVMPDGCKDFTEWMERGGTAKKFREYLKRLPPWPDAWEFNRPPTTAADVITRLPFEVEHFTFADLPAYVPEERDPNILIKGRWLERGGSAFWVSTAGTGKSIHAEQLALCFSEGLPFGGLVPLRPLRIWCYQSEDSATRLTIDREDITAELAETNPTVNWRETWNKVNFFKYPGRCGVDFLASLNEHLEASPADMRPDVIILNPLFAFIGGTITDSSYVTPFLRGGTIGHEKTPGLQYILERFKIGVLCYHHTPKPPTDKDIDAWLKSPFPEYRCAGSADITNWGRSFVTMMRVKGHRNVVCLTAGKNGGELGWDFIDGAHRRYLAYSTGRSITGRGRHAWRELEAEELAEVTAGTVASTKDADVAAIVERLKAQPMTYNQLAKGYSGMTCRRFGAAWRVVLASPEAFGLATAEARTGRGLHVFFGLPEAVEGAARECVRAWSEAGNNNQLLQLAPTCTDLRKLQDKPATDLQNAPLDVYTSKGVQVGSSEGVQAGGIGEPTCTAMQVSSATEEEPDEEPDPFLEI